MAIPILMYHQIDQPPPRGTPLRGLVVAPASFAWQMRLLRSLGFQGLSMRDLEPYLAGQKQGKVVGLTFDDGYQNNLMHALPVLQRHRFTATCYGVSGMVGGSNVWDRDKVQPKPLMTQAEWQAWLQAGMDVGSHTCSHARLTDLDAASAREEITASRQALQQLLGYEVRHFCYPYGRYDDTHAQMAREAGYASATTTQRGRVQVGDDAFKLKRIMVARATHPLQFLLKVLTRYEDKRS
jgi:peptidoglycan/xylan/chitin deacetylase (PgdA/CDA1 family)